MINPEENKAQENESKKKSEDEKASTNSNYDEHMSIDEEGNEVGPDDQI
ncbi:hypothetical protein ACVWYN_003325 [Pedobacter sp. UYP24]